MGDIIMNILLFLGLLGLIVIPVSTAFLKKTNHYKILSITGIIFSILLIFVLAPNISVDGGFTDMICTLTGILLMIVSIVIYQIFCRGNKNNK